MAELDLVAPTHPSEKKGFFNRLFHKEQPAPPAPAPAAAPQNDVDNVDLDEIKKKLGLDEPEVATQEPVQELQLPEEPPAIDAPHEQQEETPSELFDPPALPEEEETPKEHVEIHDWTADDQDHAIPEASSWDNHEEETPEVKSDWDNHQEELPEVKSDWDTQEPQAETPVAEETSWDKPSEEPVAEEVPSQELSSWDEAQDAVPEPTEIPEGKHTEVIDKQFANFEKKHEQMQKVLDKTDVGVVADWHLQEREVPQDAYFILRNGHPVKSLQELRSAVEFIDEDTFLHHVTDHRNDFADWIEGALSDKELAQQVRDSISQEGMATVLGLHHEEAHKRIKSAVSKSQRSVKKLGELNSKVAALKKELKQKTKELHDEKKAAAKRLKKAVTKEIHHHVSAEKEKLAHAHKQAEETKKELDSKLKEHHATRKKHDKHHETRMQKLEAKEEQIAQEAAHVKEERTALKTEQEEASSILQDAQQVKKDLDQIKAHQKQVKEHLQSITRKEEEMAKHEATIKQREEKMATDLEAIEQDKKDLKALRAEHEKREADVIKEEAHAAKVREEAEVRRKEALATEKDMSKKLKDQTAKLERLRKSIDQALAKVITNKKKTMAAATLRKHLEQQILETKKDVVHERAELEKAAFDSYMKNKTMTTPVGQPASTDDDILRTKHMDLYRKVQEARSALEKGDVAAAKKVYNELRDAFSKLDVSAKEKNALYISIRELYDDIHLTLLEN